MCKANNNFSKNLKNLRKNYGETQLDLAFAIGFSNDVPISYYENEKRYPKPDTLKKIAEHYRISEDYLVNGEIVENNVFEKEITYKDINGVALKMIPLVCTEEALKNSHFKKGLECHKRYINAIKNNIGNFDYSDIYEKSIDEYEKANIPEAYANILWWTIFWSIVASNIQAAELIDEFEYRRIDSMQKMLKIGFLRDFSEDITEEPIDFEFLESLNEVAEEAIKNLKSYKEWTDLVYFYTAMRYLFCYIDNGRSENQNKEIGAEMLIAFYDLGNKYVRNFMNLFYKFLK